MTWLPSFGSMVFVVTVGVLDGCGGDGRAMGASDGDAGSPPDASADPDAARRTFAPCTDAVATACGSGQCPDSWANAMAFASEYCRTVPVVTNTTAAYFSHCGAYDVLSEGDGFVGETFYFDAITGQLVADVAFGDSHDPPQYCLGGPTDFAVPQRCVLERRVGCFELNASGTDAGD